MDCIQLEKEGNMFQIHEGVRQGDHISPTLFLAVLEMIFRNLEWKDKAITLTHLGFITDKISFTLYPAHSRVGT